MIYCAPSLRVFDSTSTDISHSFRICLVRCKLLPTFGKIPWENRRTYNDSIWCAPLSFIVNFQQMSSLRRFFTGTSLSRNRNFHAPRCLCISRARFPSWSFFRFSSLALDSDMSPSTTDSKSEPSTVRLPQPIRTQLTDPTDSLYKSQSPPSAGPGAVDPFVIPPSHRDRSRTLVLCFDGTGDQFDTDVCAISLFTRFSPYQPNLAPRIRTSFSSFRCSRRMTRVSRWSTIRSAELDCPIF